jgi:Ca-activated chloride channel homolog
VTDQVVVTYPHPAWKILPAGHFDAPNPAVIQKSFVMLNIYIGFESACRMYHLGQPLAALQLLERLIAAVEDFNEELADVDMQHDLALLRQLASVIRANRPDLVEPDTWDIPEDPWPAD